MLKEIDDMKEEMKIKDSNDKQKCRKITLVKNPKVLTTKNGRIVLFAKCAVCNSKKWKFFCSKSKKLVDH